MAICIVCSKSIDDSREVFVHPTDKTMMHSSCAEVYVPGQSAPAELTAANTGALSCKQCGGEMAKTKKVNRNMNLQLVGVLLFFLGVALFAVIPPFGVIAGLVVMVIAARLGYSQKKVWKCVNCGYFFERA